jgi:hypothetical protein
MLPRTRATRCFAQTQSHLIQSPTGCTVGELGAEKTSERSEEFVAGDSEMVAGLIYFHDLWCNRHCIYFRVGESEG